MVNVDLSLIAVLVDRSGSMASCREDMQGGLNTFLTAQAKEPGLLDVTIAQFDTTYDMVVPMTRVNAESVPVYELEPRGGTALLDAMGRFITETGEALAKKREHERPGKVAVMIVTDGYENSSREWSRKQVKKLVEQQHDGYQWEFIFLGANMDAVAEGQSLGVSRDSSLTYVGAAAMDSYAVASAGVTGLRTTGKSVNFSSEDRSKAMGKK